jgi:hypothetical protein
MTEQSKNLLQIKAFSEPIIVKGFTYYDSHSRIFNIIRLPAVMGYLFPQIKKRKIRFEIRCFPNSKELRDYLDNTSDIPLLLNLYERDEDSG